MIALFEFQQNAVEELMDKSSKLLNSNEKDKYILLEAITGSGKTIMMISYIQKMFEAYDDIAFIWISVGKGKLHIQNAKKIDQYTSNDINVIFFGVDEEGRAVKKDITMERLEHKDILVLNWESINTKEDNNFSNILMREGEKRNIFELLENTVASGIKIILIIDESHHTAGSKTSREIITRFNPVFTVEITATPNTDRIPDARDININKAFYVGIKEEDVISAGVIKKKILANKNFEHTNDVSIIEKLINISLEKHTEIYKAYEFRINPLILIQIPNKEEGEILKAYVEGILEKHGISRKNENLAIWTSDDKEYLEPNIANFNSNVKCLIFKEAIATGWDCPRAQILIKLRETRSESFNIQVIGRILRMPELKHYDNEILNYAYIYTNEESVVVEGNFYNDKIMTDKVYVKEEFKYKNEDKFKSSYVKKHDYTNSIEEKVDIKLKMRLDKFRLDELLSDEKLTITIQSEEDYSIEEIKPKNKGEERLDHRIETFIANKADINFYFNSLAKSISQRKRLPVGEILIRYFKERYKREEIKLNYDDVYSSVVLKEKSELFYSGIFDEIFDEINKETIIEIDEEEIIIPPSREYNSKDSSKLTDRFNKCIYDRHKESDYFTERIFEEYIDKCNNVLFWYKNFDSGREGLAIPYRLEGKKSLFYPDYIIKFRNDSIGIYEVKHVDDPEERKTDKKILSLMKYLQQNQYKGGLIKVNSSSKFISNIWEYSEFN